MMKGSAPKKALIYLFCIVLMAFALFPIYWMLISSFKLSTDILKYPPAFIPKTWTLSNYVTVWNKAPWPRFFFNSIFVTLSVVFGCLLFSSMAAYAFAKTDFPGNNVLFMLFLSSMMIPSVVILIPQFVLMKSLRMLNSYPALILPFFFGNAFSIFFMRNFFMSVPMPITEAAEIDGCGQVRIFAQICIPMSRHALLTLGLLRAVQVWNDFMWPLIVTNSENLRTVPLAISTIFYTNRSVDWECLMTASCIGLIPLMMLFLLGKDYLLESIGASAFK